jgi:hypothetical protein
MNRLPHRANAKGRVNGMGRVRNDLIRLIDEALSDDPRVALAASHALEGEVDWLVKRAVATARVRGYNWGAIGRLLGMTRQGARKRFPLEPPLAPPYRRRLNRSTAPERDFERTLNEMRARRAGRAPDPVEDDDPIAW